MAVPRMLSRGRSLLPRIFTPSTARVTYARFTPVRAPLLQHNFSSSISARDDTVQTPSEKPAREPPAPGSLNARSIAIMKIQKQATRADIEKVLQNKGFNIKSLSFRLNRFTFQNDTKCFVELESDEEAARAVKELHESPDFPGFKPVVAGVFADFKWRPSTLENLKKAPYGPLYFPDDGTAVSAREALRPLIEGRRYMLSVKTPGWTEDKVSVQKENGYRIIKETFDKYGVETLGLLSPFHGDKQDKPRLLCFIDFTTKEGAENAARDIHNTEVAGKLTWLQPCEPMSWRSHQYGKVSPKLLAELQEKGIVPEKVEEDKFVNPIKK